MPDPDLLAAELARMQAITDAATAGPWAVTEDHGRDIADEGWSDVSLRNHVYICDLGYDPATTPLKAPPATTPDCEPHEPHPSGYIAHSEWADAMMETHTQRECRGCGRRMIWEPKEKPGGE